MDDQMYQSIIHHRPIRSPSLLPFYITVRSGAMSTTQFDPLGRWPKQTTAGAKQGRRENGLPGASRNSGKKATLAAAMCLGNPFPRIDAAVSFRSKPADWKSTAGAR